MTLYLWECLCSQFGSFLLKSSSNVETTKTTVESCNNECLMLMKMIILSVGLLSVENDKGDLTKTKKKEMSAQTRALLLKLGYSNRYHHLQKGIVDDHDYWCLRNTIVLCDRHRCLEKHKCCLPPFDSPSSSCPSWNVMVMVLEMWSWWWSCGS